MFGNGTKLSIKGRGSLPSPQYTSPSDSEGEIVLELEQKRRQMEDEISKFRAEKEREFREFEKDLRASKRRSICPPSAQIGKNRRSELSEKPPSRTSSSSALNLLAGRGITKQSQTSSASRKSTIPSQQSKVSSRAAPSASQPVVSLDKQNIKGETAVPQTTRPRTPPTPTLLSRTLTRSSSSSSLATSPPKDKRHSSLKISPRTSPPPSPYEDERQSSLTGIFTPSYIQFIDPNTTVQYQSTSALETPPAEDEAATAPSSYKSSTLETLPVSSSSFPPHSLISPGNHSHASKRAYTAPTVSSNRIPSALRTASGGTIVRKRKHVTFRLADSAIVEPSSSYEEGPSPSLEEGESEKPKAGTRSPLRTKQSQLSRTLSPDEEDAEAGVKPGMGMGDVIQKLNEYTVSEAAKHGEELVLEVNGDEGDEDSDEDQSDRDDDQDEPMLLGHHQASDEEDDSDRHLTVNYHDHEDEPQIRVNVDNINNVNHDEHDYDDEDGYFSPKAKHISTVTPIARGNSPLTPYRDGNWAELSSSDKDRLLFETRRHSNDSDDLRQRRIPQIASPIADESGFSGGLRQSLDGGSGVGFFELDEELASPDAGHPKPFTFEQEPESEEVEDDAIQIDKDEKNSALVRSDLTNRLSAKGLTFDERKRLSGESISKFGVGSVPIDIIRPSLSVSSSWVGTFGH